MKKGRTQDDDSSYVKKGKENVLRVHEGRKETNTLNQTSPLISLINNEVYTSA